MIDPPAGEMIAVENSRTTSKLLPRARKEVMQPMDPRLQRALAQRRGGFRRLATSSTGEDEIAVIARVSDVAAWESLSEVSVGAVLGMPDENGESIVTARIPIVRIEDVRRQPFVKSLKAAQRLRRQLAASVSEVLAQPAQLPGGHGSNGGRGVVMGIIDYGCDFAHQNFIDAKGKSRILKLWDQGAHTAAGGAPYGARHSAADMNAALKTTNPYSALGYRPGSGAHGTHVMDIAAGNGRGTNVSGMAPLADIVFVEVDDSDVPFSGPRSVGHSFGDSVRLLEAAKFIFDEAGNRPCVINMSLGTNGGPHDGTTLFEQGLDRLLRQQDNRAAVIAASNSYADGIHQSGRVEAHGEFDLAWDVPAGDATENEIEVWYPGARRLACDLIQPDGEHLGRIDPGETGTVRDASGNVVIFVSNRLDDPNNHDNTIGVWLDRTRVPGQWTLKLIGDGRGPTDFHAWIERDDDGQSSFPNLGDQGYTVGSISCGQETIVVGSYDAHKASVPLSWFSSAGPTRDGRKKPEVSAPGHDVRAAKSESGSGVTKKSGTSMASPATAGMVALLFAAASKHGVNLPIAKTRELVIRAARRNPPPGSGWDPRYGFGRISAAGAISELLKLAGTPHTASKASKPKTSKPKKVVGAAKSKVRHAKAKTRLASKK